MKNLRNVFYCVLTALAATVVLSSCGKDDDKKGGPVTIVENGFYVVGEATSIADINAGGADKALMAQGTNEVDKKVRDGLYEKYVALESGKNFSVVLKEGTTETTYGAMLNLTGVLDGADEPAIQVWKGDLVVNGAPMQVTSSGLYHIAIDLNKDGALPAPVIVVAPVTWGVRGAMNGWGYTELTPGDFSKTSITYTLTGAEVASTGAFKFSYGGGWKIQLDAQEKVKLETNLGGTKDALVPGGGDVSIARGIFTIKLTWTLSGGDVTKGYTATIDKTASLETQNFTDCELELVGLGVGSSNPGAVADGSSWLWGNVLSAGTPAVSGNTYTWTWSNVALIGGVGNGFKVRTVGAAVSGGIAAFDKGAEIITSAPAGTSTNSDIILPEDGNYNLVLTLNADEETYSLVITKL